MRLIDADKFKFKFPYWIDHNGILMVPYNSCKCSLDAAPTVDAVPVVRCRDCIHREGDENPMCMLHTEPYANARGYKGEAVCVEMDDFCSYGKRREPDGK